jgi:hypothetical protein
MSLKNLKVGIVGVINNQESSNYKIYRELCNLVTAIPFDYRTEMSNDFPRFHEKLTILSRNVDVIIICKGSGISIDTIKEIGKKCKLYHYFMDPFDTLQRIPNLIEMSKYCDWRSATGKEIAMKWEDEIQLPVQHVLDGCDTTTYFKEQNINQIYDVSFIGTATSERNYIKEQLDKHKISNNFQGPGYTQYINENEFRRICNQSKIMLNISRGIQIGYTSLRLWSTLGCGSFVLTKRIIDIEKYLNLYLMTHLDEFSSILDLVEKIRYYLNNENERNEIAHNAYGQIHNNVTWKHTVENMLDVIHSIKPSRGI